MITTQYPLKIAINGFGRIGRMILRSLYESQQSNIKIVAINDIAPLDTLAHLLRHDSIHGTMRHEIQIKDNMLCVDRDEIGYSQEHDPHKLSWKNVDMVYECSGKLTSYDAALTHIQCGAQKVIVSAPCKNAELTVVYGVNHDKLSREHRVISNASCTTNCLAPVLHVLHNAFGVVSGYMTTVHAYTADQRLHDAPHDDLRRARAATLSMIPTSTGAARSIGLVLPELEGKLDGSAIRVPTPNVSLIDLCLVTQQNMTVETVNAKLKEAADGLLKGVIRYTEEPLVSVDLNHDPHSSVFDATQTQVISKNFCRILAWYDNEWGFANRMHDVASHWGRL